MSKVVKAKMIVLQKDQGPKNGGKMTGMDLLEFGDNNGPDPMPIYGAI